MTRRRRLGALALALTIGLLLGSLLAIWRPNGPGSSRARESLTGPSASSTPTPTAVPGPTKPPATRPQQPTRLPPTDSVHTADRYLASYGATRVSWDDVLAAGRPLPGVSGHCRNSWRTSGKDPRLDWDAGTFMCLNRLPGQAFRPQGVAGSATTRGYRIGTRPAADRNLILTSWYSKRPETNLVAPPRPDQSVTRLVIMDMDRRRYQSVELVRPDGAGRFQNLNSHGSGLLWAGQYLYSSSRSTLWMYNSDDLLDVGGRFVLPAVAAWNVDGLGGLSSISLDRSSRPARMTAINYSKQGLAHLQSFELQGNGLLAANPDRSRRGLVLRNLFGENGRAVSSGDYLAVPGSSFQGVATVGPYGLVNSSALELSGDGPVDATVVLEDGEVIDRFRMPRGNIESIYLDHRRKRFVSITELGSQFLFTLPIEELTGR